MIFMFTYMYYQVANVYSQIEVQKSVRDVKQDQLRR